MEVSKSLTFLIKSHELPVSSSLLSPLDQTLTMATALEFQTQVNSPDSLTTTLPSGLPMEDLKIKVSFPKQTLSAIIAQQALTSSLYLYLRDSFFSSRLGQRYSSSSCSHEEEVQRRWNQANGERTRMKDIRKAGRSTRSYF